MSTHVLAKELRREGLSNATVNRYTAAIRRAFNLALRWEVYEGKPTSPMSAFRPACRQFEQLPSRRGRSFSARSQC